MISPALLISIKDIALFWAEELRGTAHEKSETLLRDLLSSLLRDELMELAKSRGGERFKSLLRDVVGAVKHGESIKISRSDFLYLAGKFSGLPTPQFWQDDTIAERTNAEWVEWYEWLFDPSDDERLIASLTAARRKGPTPKSELRPYIRRQLKAGVDPGNNMRWDEFCHNARVACNAGQVRGMGDRTIKNAVADIRKGQ